MILLVGAAHPTIMRWRETPNGRMLGRLAQPRDYARVHATAAAGVPWAADNDAFNGFDVASWRKMMAAIDGVQGCRFCTAPDVVGDAAATGDLFVEYAPEIRAAGLPVALVLQDGITSVPWRELDAVFVGGTTDFKLGPDAARIVREARTRGKWVHMGRVNTVRRIRYAATIGCDSFDGTQWSRWRDTHLPKGLIAAANAAAGRQLQLMED